VSNAYKNILPASFFGNGIICHIDARDGLYAVDGYTPGCYSTARKPKRKIWRSADADEFGQYAELAV
jgi:hypothetical protein